MNAEITKAKQDAANHSAANWFNKDIFYALIAPTSVSRFGLALLFLAQLGLAFFMLKQASVGGVLIFWCLISTLVSVGLIRPLLQRYAQAQTLRLQPYFYRHFVVVLVLISAVFALLPISIFMLQYQAYNLISIWLVCVSGALAGMWGSYDWQQVSTKSWVIRIIWMVLFIAIWFGLLQSSETLAGIVRGELPEVVLGCYILSAFFLLSPYILDWKESKTPVQVRSRASKSLLPIRLRLLLSIDNQQFMFAIFVPLLCPIVLLIADWLGVYYQDWGTAVITIIGVSIGGLLPNQLNMVFQAKPALFERLAFTLAINPLRAQRQIYQTILMLFFIVVVITALLIAILAIINGDIVLLVTFFVVCTLVLWLNGLQHYFGMVGGVFILMVIAGVVVWLFTVFFNALFLTIAAALCFLINLGYCYFKPPKAPFEELL